MEHCQTSETHSVTVHAKVLVFNYTVLLGLLQSDLEGHLAPKQRDICTQSISVRGDV